MSSDIETLLQQLTPAGPDDSCQFDDIELKLKQLQPRSKPDIPEILATTSTTWRFEYACAALILLGIAWNIIIIAEPEETAHEPITIQPVNIPEITDPILVRRLQQRPAAGAAAPGPLLSARLKEWQP